MSKKFKNIKSKEQVLESWTPVLSGDYVSSPGSNSCEPNFIPPDQRDDGCADMIDPPAWLDPDNDHVFRGGDRLSIGTFYINGAPLSNWSTRLGGSGVAAYRHSMMQNWFTTQTLFKRFFPNGLKLNNEHDFEELKISKLKVIKMNPTNGGIYFDLFISFKILTDDNEKDDDNQEIFGKFINLGSKSTPDFQCKEISKLNKETKIKIKGKLWNLIKDWFKAKPGIYNTIANEVLVYNEFGQLIRLHIDNKVEVLSATDDTIRLTYDNNIYIIKKPTYYWFNWYFEKI